MQHDDRFFLRHTYGPWVAQENRNASISVKGGEGAYFYDTRNRRYLDFSSQLMCLNLGYGNQALADAIARQARELAYVAPRFATDAAREATRALLEVAPEGLDAFFFSTSGTEANEAAVKIVRQYAAPHYKIISRYASYHGVTGGSIAVTGDYRRWSAEPVGKMPGTVFAPDAYCYRCPFHLEYPACGIQCAQYVDYMVKREGNVAALLVEPVVGTNGVIVPPPGYLPHLRQIADSNGVLLVVDEVMTGWYRTGTWFAVEHWQVKPDIITTAKGSTGAYSPLGITMTTGTIREYFEENCFSHGHTYAMHPVSLAAMCAAIKEYRRLAHSGLLKRVATHLKQRLGELQRNHPCLGDVRGLGHFWGLELVKNRHEKTPFDPFPAGPVSGVSMSRRIASEALRRGLHVVAWPNYLIVAPPLVVEESDIDRGVAVLDEVLEFADLETTN